jgi:uncharacterized protein
MTGVTDVHVHIQPWRQLKPHVLEVMRSGKEKEAEWLMAVMENPAMALELMDKEGIWRVGMVNYPSPDVMGFTPDVSEIIARYAEANPERLLPYGGVHPLFTRDPVGDVDRLVEMGIRVLKIHPPHQCFAANAYTDGLESLAMIYRRCEERGLPVMIHTGTSVFPGARSKYGHPLELDDLGVDFPDLPIIMAHGGRPLWMTEAFFVLRRHRNIWLDLSGIPPAKLLDYFPRVAEISDRVLWGTDWPSMGVKGLRQNLDQFMSLPLDDAIKRRITVDNPLTLLPTR